MRIVVGMIALSLLGAAWAQPKGVPGKEISAKELTAAHLGAMQAAAGLNAFITETPDQALALRAVFRRSSHACLVLRSGSRALARRTPKA